MASLTTSATTTTTTPTTSSTTPPSTAPNSSIDQTTRQRVSAIPLCTVDAGPRDGDDWKRRLKEEIRALIAYIRNNKTTDSDWITIKPNADGTFWEGRCWMYHKSVRHEFAVQFEIPATYPHANPEIQLPELEGKTEKMYRGGKICLTAHFMPLWRSNSPKFGICHALALGLGPWMASVLPGMIDEGIC
jgi:ufm1-conjugating enzyme 1